MSKCPHCGYDDKLLTEPKDILQFLYSNPSVEVYKPNGGGNWCFTNNAGLRAAPEAVLDLVRRCLVNKVYSDIDGTFWLGRTLDVDATLAARKAGQPKAKIYLEAHA